MEIINKIEAKVKSAIQKIEQLEMRILELEDEKKESDEKLQSILQALGPIEIENEINGDSSGTETDLVEAEANESDSEVSMHDSDNLYSGEQRHQF